MSKFLAARLLMSPVGGNLVFVYSTSLDRAQEVLRAAKVYIDWIVTDPPQWAPKVAKARAPPPHTHTVPQTVPQGPAAKLTRTDPPSLTLTPNWSEPDYRLNRRSGHEHRLNRCFVSDTDSNRPFRARLPNWSETVPSEPG
jgi:hypothetical protein